MPKIPCAGCGESFDSNRAWSNHLAQTANKTCRAIHDQQQSYLPGADNPASSSPPQSPLFAGDFFGADYNDHDFPGPWDDQDHEPRLPALDSGSDSDEPEPEEPPAWEPQPHPLPALPSDSDDEMEEEYGRLLSREERQNAEKTQWSAPIIDVFPSPRAGEVVERETESDSGYERYKEGLPGAAANNPYAPFTSKVDWEFARWAKLRGAGSTAVTELMGIEGVRPHQFLISYFNINLRYRYKKNWGCRTKIQTS